MSKTFREKIIALHKQGKGYKKIGKVLNVLRDIVGSIVRKCKVTWQKKEAINGCHQIPVEAGGQKPSTDCKIPAADPVVAGTEVSVSTVRHILNTERLYACTPLPTQKHKNLLKTIKISQRGFGILFCGAMKQNWNFSGRMKHMLKRTPCLR